MRRTGGLKQVARTDHGVGKHVGGRAAHGGGSVDHAINMGDHLAEVAAIEQVRSDGFNAYMRKALAQFGHQRIWRGSAKMQA